MTEDTGEKEFKVYPGTDISVTWQRKLCIHVGECGRADDELFIAKRDPWCDPDEVSVDRVSEVVERCPTGALSYTRVDNRQENRPSENTVHVASNGPLYLRGQLEIQGVTQDMKGLKYRAALCRCGASQNKPFCDGSHTEERFEDAGAVGETGESLSASNGPLQINPAKNGPLVLRGNMCIYSGSGRKAWQGKQTSLCRCGKSANKPFCDGSHNR